MMLSTAVTGLTSFVIPKLMQLPQLVAVWALQNLCYAGGDPAERALVADLTGGDQHGRAYGLYATAAGLGMRTLLLAAWLREPRRAT
jgi:MFS family permease